MGPIWCDGQHGEAKLLTSAYQENLKVSEENKLRSISFPPISTGAYRYPVNEAAKVAIQAVISFLEERAASITDVVFVLFDFRTYEAYRKALQAKKKQ